MFAGTSYRFANLDYPLLVPSLEAIDFRAMDAFDTRLLHVQFLLFLVAAILALVALLRDVVPPLILWTSVLALAVAPAVFDQLLTAYADLPLALVFGVGVAAIGRWMKTNERWSLAVATLCFAGVLLMKNEGALVVFGVFLGLFAGEDAAVHKVGRGRHAWVQIIEGELNVNDVELTVGDGAAVSDEVELRLRAKTPTHFLLFDLA